MLDFSSALYLGLRHPATSLRPWAQLTTGRPAALQEPPGSDGVISSLARLVRCERATLSPSTLHLFWDLFDVLATEPIGIYVDEGTYPIARWGVERVGAKKVPIAYFQRHDPAALENLLRRHQSNGLRPVVVTDGLYPATGRVAPLAEYLRLIRARNGHLVIDDTQALGILGHGPMPGAPYGRGGGGTPAWHGIQGPELIVGSSLAKGFGVPLAILAGSAQVIAKFEDLAPTRVHCSPPSAPLISAAEQALMINEVRGGGLRSHLAMLVRHFRNRLRQVGLSASGGFFPVQTLAFAPGLDAFQLHARLLDLGVMSVLHRLRRTEDAKLSFLITALHTPSDIEGCVQTLQRACLSVGRK